jgi:hypothetical protein
MSRWISKRPSPRPTKPELIGTELRYDQPCVPTLSEADHAWAAEQIKNAPPSHI